MYKILCIFIIYIFFPNDLNADTYYIWTENNVKHFTNIEQNAHKSQANHIDVKNFKIRNTGEQNNSKTDQPESSGNVKETETEYKHETELRELWQSRMEDIKSRIRQKENQLAGLNRRIERLDREIEYLLIHGYSADHMIYELKTLENSIPTLKSQIGSLEEEKEKIKAEARKKGIPPGYLRP